jgi:hypothetical protein
MGVTPKDVGQVTAVTIEIDVPDLLPQLLDGLEAAGCSAEVIGAGACRVVHTEALDDNEALTELRFFVRVWAGGHDGVTAILQPV